DSDGCQDVLEDLDDDNDLIPDALDFCTTGILEWESNLETDYDADGCNDGMEDFDDDSDGVEDRLDLCIRGKKSWISDAVLDYDSDGCRDSDEDLDDDNDGVVDTLDSCQKGDLDWQSSNATDSDADGCQDLTEDLDYEPPEEGENLIDCNPYITTCDEVEDEEEQIAASDSEEGVQSLILGILAMALVPTILGGLLIAYRVRW
ncbi:MAG TPA: hypothetical protein HA356_05145, partial [Candidatus Poseidoniaceae archaeon]